MKFLALVSAFLIAVSSQDVTTQTISTENCVADKTKTDFKKQNGNGLRSPHLGLETFDGKKFKGVPKDGFGDQGGHGRPKFGGPGGERGFGKPFEGPPKIDTSTLTVEQKVRYDELHTAIENWRSVYTPPERPLGQERPQIRLDSDKKVKSGVTTTC